MCRGKGKQRTRNRAGIFGNACQRFLKAVFYNIFQWAAGMTLTNDSRRLFVFWISPTKCGATSRMHTSRHTWWTQKPHTDTYTHSSSPEPALPKTPDLVHATIRLLLEKKSQRLHSCVWTAGQPRVPPLILHTTPSHARIQGSYQSLMKVGAGGVLEFISQAAHIYSVETSSSLSGSETRLSQSDQGLNSSLEPGKSFAPQVRGAPRG